MIFARLRAFFLLKNNLETRWGGGGISTYEHFKSLFEILMVGKSNWFSRKNDSSKIWKTVLARFKEGRGSSKIAPNANIYRNV